MDPAVLTVTPPTHDEVIAKIKPSGRLVVALSLSLGVFVLEVGGGLITGSLALLGDATHVLVDVAVVLIGLGAARLASRVAAADLGMALPSDIIAPREDLT